MRLSVQCNHLLCTYSYHLRFAVEFSWQSSARFVLLYLFLLCSRLHWSPLSLEWLRRHASARPAMLCRPSCHHCLRPPPMQSTQWHCSFISLRLPEAQGDQSCLKATQAKLPAKKADDGSCGWPWKLCLAEMHTVILALVGTSATSAFPEMKTEASLEVTAVNMWVDVQLWLTVYVSSSNCAGLNGFAPLPTA